MSEAHRQVTIQPFNEGAGSQTTLLGFEIAPPIEVHSEHFLSEGANRQLIRDRKQGIKTPYDPFIENVVLTHSDESATYGIIEIRDTCQISAEDKTRIVKESFRESLDPLHKLGETALRINFDYPEDHIT